MGNGDARSLDHMTLEALRMRAVRSVQGGERPSAVARALSVTLRTMYGWLARYRHGGLGRLQSETVFRPPPHVKARALPRLSHPGTREETLPLPVPRALR